MGILDLCTVHTIADFFFSPLVFLQNSTNYVDIIKVTRSSKCQQIVMWKAAAYSESFASGKLGLEGDGAGYTERKRIY